MYKNTKLRFHNKDLLCAWLYLLLIGLGALGCVPDVDAEHTLALAAALPSSALIKTSLSVSAVAASFPQPTAIVSPMPTSALRNLRVSYPASWQDFPMLFVRFSSRYPAGTFTLSAAENEQQIAAVCGEGRAALAIYEGAAIPAGLGDAPYRERPIALAVAFGSPVQELSSEQLQALLRGDTSIKNELGIGRVLAWDAQAAQFANDGKGEIEIAPSAEIVKRVAQDKTLLGLLPYVELAPSVRALPLAGADPSEPGYQLVMRSTVLACDRTLNSAAEELAAVLRAEYPPEPSEITLAAVGDMMLARDMGRALLAYGAEYPFQTVREWLSQADVAMGNLECPISERGEPERKGYTFRAPASAVAALQNGGFDVLTLANNHALDYGLLAFQDTLDLLAQAGIKTIGAGLNETSAYAPVMLTVKGVRLAFLAYARYPTEGASGYQGQSAVASGDRPGIAWAELERIKRDVVSAKAQADLVIVALHAGQEYAESPDDLQRQAARAAIDAGACLVWGHHPHVLQGIEFYRDGVILYSLGDFVFDQMPDNDTVIARVRLDRRGARQVELLPVTIVENGRPASADAAQGQRILRRVYSLSDVLR